LVEKPKGKRQLGRPRPRREENIKIGLKNSLEGFGLNPCASE